MNQYRIVHSGVHAAIAALCWMVLSHLNEVEAYITSLKPILTEYKGFAVPALIAILALLFRVSDKLATVVIEKVPLFSFALRRLLSGRDFIEGDWPLVVVDMATERLLYLGFLSISFKRGQLYVYGNDWSPEAAHAMEFQSKQSLYENCKLQYWYEQGASLHKVDMRGYTEIYFFPRIARAERHAGKFLDASHMTDIRFYATRKTYALFERRLATKDKQFAAAKALWATLEPRFAELKAREISCDFE